MLINMIKTIKGPLVGAVLAVVWFAILGTAPQSAQQGQDLPQLLFVMPEFTSKSPSLWLNSKPLTRAELKGKVVLLEIWTSI